VLVSALVCTRNRPGPIAHAVPSLLGGDSEPFELLVIDQSDGPETEQALAPFRKDSRLAYHRSATRGKGAALNEGLRLAKGSIVVCTDDDCEVPRGWVMQMAKILSSHPDAAIAFCNVIPVPHDRNAGYVPAYERTTDRLLSSISDVREGLGLGAAMALRRDFALSVGGFDESFGPGARFPSADEWDISIRALLKGWSIYETPEVSVIHDGFRTFDEGRKHVPRDWTALGAVCAKPIRAGHFRALVVPVWFFTANALIPPISDMIRLRKPRGLSRILAFFKGFAAGLGTPVDPQTLRFEKRS
jgi:glycosyltransferase involved in cell wall biosynthesis